MKFDTEKKYYVYAWYIKNTREVFYIGKGTGNRYKTRKRENSFFMKMLESHDCESKIVKDNLDEESAFKLEKEMIAYCRSIYPRMTNVLDGGENPPKQTGIPKTESFKNKVSESNKKFYAEHPEHRIQSSERMKAFLKTEEGKEFSRKSIEARQSDSFKELLREKCTAANNTPEYKKRQSDLMKEKYKSQEVRKKLTGANNKMAQPVMQFDLAGNLIKEFETLTQASKETGILLSRISSVANGDRKTAGGYVWKFSTDRRIRHKESQKGISNPKCQKKILQFDLSGNFIKEYSSIAESARENGFKNHTNIICNLKGKTKHAYGFIWKYKHDDTVPSL